jgi:hypothetical protein
MALSGPTETVISAPRQLRLSQATPPPSSVPAPPCPVPPGPLQLPDGKIIQLDDPITLGELWEILPYLAQQCSPPPAQTPQQQPTGIPTSPVGAGFPGFGPASGAFGQGGFIGQGGGGNLFGPLGQVSTPIPQPGGGGSVGPQGPPGPPGAGAVIDFVVKDDGDFTTGSGSPVPVPGTLLSFVQGVSGNALFIINANTSLNGGLPVQNILGIQIDGGVVTILQQTNVPPIDKNPISPNWAQFLVAGPHTVQVVYTGFAVFRLNANPSQPLVLSVVHS